MKARRRIAARLGGLGLVTLLGLGAFSVADRPSRAYACTPFTIIEQVSAHEPYRSGFAGVTFPGEVRTTKDFCGDEAKVIGERKVCGAFGCNYHEIADSGWKPVEGTRLELSIEGPCKGGKHRYRTRVIYHAPRLAAPEPGYVREERRESGNMDCPG